MQERDVSILCLPARYHHHSLFQTLQLGTTDAEIKFPSHENPELSKSPFLTAVGQNIDF